MNPVIVLCNTMKKRKTPGFIYFVIPLILLTCLFNRGVLAQVYERTVKGLVVDSGTGKPMQDTI